MGWNVANVTSMAWMFASASSFNSDISKWDVSRVTDMRSMFYSATSFSRTLCGAWKKSTASKTDMFTGSSGKMCSSITTTMSTTTTTPKGWVRPAGWVNYPTWGDVLTGIECNIGSPGDTYISGSKNGDEAACKKACIENAACRAITV